MLIPLPLAAEEPQQSLTLPLHWMIAPCRQSRKKWRESKLAMPHW